MIPDKRRTGLVCGVVMASVIGHILSAFAPWIWWSRGVEVWSAISYGLAWAALWALVAAVAFRHGPALSIAGPVLAFIVTVVAVNTLTLGVRIALSSDPLVPIEIVGLPRVSILCVSSGVTGLIAAVLLFGWPATGRWAVLAFFLLWAHAVLVHHEFGTPYVLKPEYAIGEKIIAEGGYDERRVLLNDTRYEWTVLEGARGIMTYQPGFPIFLCAFAGWLSMVLRDERIPKFGRRHSGFAHGSVGNQR